MISWYLCFTARFSKLTCISRRMASYHKKRLYIMSQFPRCLISSTGLRACRVNNADLFKLACVLSRNLLSKLGKQSPLFRRLRNDSNPFCFAGNSNIRRHGGFPLPARPRENPFHLRMIFLAVQEDKESIPNHSGSCFLRATYDRTCSIY